MPGMTALGTAAWLLGAYLAGAAIFLLIVHLWLSLDRRRSPRARPGRALLSELGWAAATEWTVPLAFLLWPRWWRRPRPQTSGRPPASGPQAPRHHPENGPEPLGAGNASSGHRAAPPSLPVVLVHGWGQNRADFWGLALHLRRHAAHSIYAFDYWFFGPVERSAERLGRVVGRALREQGAQRVHLVCHSLGGLVARVFVEQQGGAAQVASVIFVGSPLGGTHRASTGFGRAARQMTPGSPFLAALGPPAPPAGVRYRSVWSHSDAMVVPPGSASLHGQGEELELEDAGHLGLLYRPEVARQIRAWLAQAQEQPQTETRTEPEREAAV